MSGRKRGAEEAMAASDLSDATAVEAGKTNAAPANPVA